MPSHRSANFSRLKELLPAVPAANPEAGADSLTENTPDPENDIRHTVDVQPQATARLRSSLMPKPGRARLLTRPSTFRLAIELQDALKVVADYNRLNMTDIVAEGIWLHLQNFEWPPGSEELRSKVQALLD